jgi:hypothetical protein
VLIEHAFEDVPRDSAQPTRAGSRDTPQLMRLASVVGSQVMAGLAARDAARRSARPNLAALRRWSPPGPSCVVAP